MELQPSPHDPGGKTVIPLPLWVRGSAVFGGPNRIYRYELSRSWNDQLPAMLFVGMNPSTAGPSYDDPTIYKVRRYAEDWEFGGLLVGNAFAYRATDQKRLLEVADPVGPEQTPLGRDGGMKPEQKQAVEMMEIDQADFHITHRLDDGEEPILHLTTAKNCPNNRDHFSFVHLACLLMLLKHL